jgi:hypothetical protein
MNVRALATAAAALALAGGGLASTDPEPVRDTTMNRTASGTFDVKAAPVAQETFSDGLGLGRYSLDKTYHGDLEAAAKGEMLTAGTAVEGSAGYVATERVEGTLHGRRGSFVLLHRGTMGRGEQQLSITVLRDSGTGELAGLEGELVVTIAPDGEHRYALEHTLPGEP